MMALWEAMLAADWKVGKDRERRANANPSKYQIPASVLKKITHEQVAVALRPENRPVPNCLSNFACTDSTNCVA